MGIQDYRIASIVNYIREKKGESKRALREENFTLSSTSDTGKLKDENRIEDYLSDDDTSMSVFMSLRIRGGGGRNQRVIKTIVKNTDASSSSLLVADDMQKFNAMVVASTHLATATVATAKIEIASLGVPVLEEMLRYLQHSKSTNTAKLAGLLDFIPPIDNMNKGMEKIATTKEKMTKLFMDFFQSECADENNEVKVALVRKYLEGRVAIKKEQIAQQTAQSASRAPNAPPTGGDVAMG